MEERAAAASYIIAHPDVSEPTILFLLVRILYERGDRAQGAFWYYVWQIRSSPWRATGDFATNNLDAAIIYSWGEAINRWAGSDPSAMHDLMLRASTFERRAPLYRGHPKGVTSKRWAQMVAEARSLHDPALLSKAMPNDEAAIEAIAKGRKASGLYVGPWRDAGASLPEAWK